MYILLDWILPIVNVGCWIIAVTTVIRTRGTMIRALDQSVDEFHEAAIELVNSPSDLPDEVLDFVSKLNVAAFVKATPSAVRRSIKNARLTLTTEPSSTNAKQQRLSDSDKRNFERMTSAYMNIMVSRDLISGLRLAWEVRAFLQTSTSSPTLPSLPKSLLAVALGSRHT
jgi:hypothetical protein